MPRISVVIPAYNSEAFIQEALDSVLAQTLRPYEIIVVDDGSTDGTRRIVERYKANVKYLYQDNAGSGKARNIGIRHANGDLIAFLDSDDVWDKNHLELLSQALEKESRAGMVYSSRRWINQKGDPVRNESKQNSYPSGWIFNELFEANYIGSTSAVLIKKRVLLELGGFNESEVFRNAQDYDLWLRVAARFYIVSEPKVLFNYRRHENNRTKDERRRVKGLLAALNNAVELIKRGLVRAENHPDKIDIRDRMIRAYQNAVIALFWIGAYEDVSKIGIEAIRKKYFNSQILAKLLISFLPDNIITIIRKLSHRLIVK